MTRFQKRYKALNKNQRDAVDILEGPVMVVAGPGTGKTELLSVRVANILDKTDALPQNILCLTFTDNASANMRERLVGLIGTQAHQVAIHTFHSFGSEIINRYAEYFYNGASLRPADELSSYEIISGILGSLPPDNILASKFNGAYTYQKSVKSSISELKRGGLSPDELSPIVEQNARFIDFAKPKLNTVFSQKISKRIIPLINSLLEELASYESSSLEIPNYHPLSDVLTNSLARAYNKALDDNSTKPITAWKTAYMEKDNQDGWTLKDEKRTEKLVALKDVYYEYLLAMQKAELYDYDDMILRAVHGMEVFDELRFNLQEQYQYILVDEFQDTNDAQMRLVWNLTNNPSSEGRPNLMVVGDDDQAIYRFQGADISNILEFATRYNDVAIITLNDNYRSSKDILELSRNIVTQIEERLENSTLGISKILSPHFTSNTTLVETVSYETNADAHLKLVEQTAVLKDRGTTAVIARKNDELIELLPHFAKKGIPIRYERRDNILDSEPVLQLELIARVIYHINRQELADANAYLAELLAHPAWRLDSKKIWQLSIRSYRERKFWLETMLADDDLELRNIAEWIIDGSIYAQNQTLEYMFDYLFGVTETADGFTAPYKEYFFGKDVAINTRYLAHLKALQKIRNALREYRPGVTLKLNHFIEYLDTSRRLGVQLTTNHVEGGETEHVTLLTAHKAKGLEFDNVFIVNANESVWGSGSGKRSGPLVFPTNMHLSPTGNDSDEQLRLLYVALTRARNKLHIISSRHDHNGKKLFTVGAIDEQLFTPKPSLETKESIISQEITWQNSILNIDETEKIEILRPLLEHYKLSATHLNNFLNVTKGGPKFFLLQNLLQLPGAMSPSAIYGSVMHDTLQHAHLYLSANNKKQPIDDIIKHFDTSLEKSQLPDDEKQRLMSRGKQSLSVFLEKRYDSFRVSQKVEQNFSSESIQINNARITGKIDLMDIDAENKTIFITDYKTGKAQSSWRASKDYDKIKLHQYKQQLMMYKLLVEESRSFSGYTVTGARIEYIEPNNIGDITLLDYSYDATELAEFKKLISAVWQCILSLDFVTTDENLTKYKDIIEFEQHILEKYS